MPSRLPPGEAEPRALPRCRREGGGAAAAADVLQQAARCFKLAAETGVTVKRVVGTSRPKCGSLAGGKSKAGNLQFGFIAINDF